MFLIESMTRHGGTTAQSNPVQGPTLIQVIEEMMTAKAAANRRALYVRNLGYFLRKFAQGQENIPIRSINRQMIEAFMARRESSPNTRRSERTWIGGLFQFAIRRRYVHREQNPVDEIEHVLVERNPPHILRPDEARRLLRYARRHMQWRLAHLVLGIMGGIRPYELSRLYWRDVNVERGYVTINGAASKTRQRRIVNLDPKAVAWLKAVTSREILENKTPIGGRSPITNKWRRILAERCGVRFSQDLFRHSAASFLLAKHQDVAKVARNLGHSVQVLMTHYYNLVTPEDCRRFWYWNPKALRGELNTR